MAQSSSEKPGKKCGNSWIHYDFVCREEEDEQAKAGAILHSIKKISKLSSQKSRIRKLGELKFRIKDDEFLLKVVGALGLAHGNSDPKHAAEALAKLHSLLSTEETPLPYVEKLARPIPKINTDAFDPEELKAIASTDKHKEGVAVLEKYAKLTKDIHSLATDLQKNPVASQEEYDDKFEQVNSLFGALKAMTEQAKGLTTGNPEIDENLDAVGSRSREALPGYRVAIPKDLETVSKKAQMAPCS